MAFTAPPIAVYLRAMKSHPSFSPLPLPLFAAALSLLLCACDKDDGKVAPDAGAGDAASSPSAPSAPSAPSPDAAKEAPPATPQKQKITLDRAHQVGNRYTVVANGESKQVMEMSANGQPIPQQSKTEQFSASLEANFEVVAVSESGKCSKGTLEIKTLQRTDAGAAGPRVLLENATIVGTASATGVDWVNGDTPVEAEVAATLELFSLVSKDKAQSANEDILFGTDQEVSPGDSWPIDGQAIAESFGADTGMGLDPQSVAGTMTLEKLETVGGIQCQIISGEVTMELNEFPGLPAEAAIKNGTMTVEIGGAFPVDTSLARLRESMSMSMKPTVEFSAQGAQMAVTMEFARSAEATLTPLP